MYTSINSFHSFLLGVAAEHNETCTFAFIAIDTDDMRFPTYDNPLVNISYDEGAIGIDIIISEDANGEPLTVERLIAVSNNALEDIGNEPCQWIFKDLEGNIVFQTDSLRDYEYSVTYPDGYKSTHSF